MNIFETKALEVIERASGVKSFRFKIEEPVLFEAGQFFFVSIMIENQERTKHFSFSNSPTEKGYIEFTKRITQSDYSGALDKIKAGDWAKIKMPYGSFTLDKNAKKIAFLSGGIGITPIRSMLKYISDSKSDYNAALIYGNNTEKDIIFREDLDKMAAENDNIEIIYTLTSSLSVPGSWKGRRGYIDAAMIKRSIPDYNERTFYLCGPPPMVDSLKNILVNELKIKEDSIRVENFVGY